MSKPQFVETKEGKEIIQKIVEMRRLDKGKAAFGISN
jgi:hypothetical protein